MNPSLWTHDVQFRRPAAESVAQAGCDPAFSILHARRDLREQHIPIRKVRVARSNFFQIALLRCVELRARFAYGRHGNERHRQRIVEIARVPGI